MYEEGFRANIKRLASLISFTAFCFMCFMYAWVSADLRHIQKQSSKTADTIWGLQQQLEGAQVLFDEERNRHLEEESSQKNTYLRIINVHREVINHHKGALRELRNALIVERDINEPGIDHSDIITKAPKILDPIDILKNDLNQKENTTKQ